MLTGNKVFLDKKEEPIRETDEQIFFDQGSLALVFERPMEAARYFLLMKESKNSAVFFNLALCFFKAKEYAEAQRYLQKALMELPRNSSTVRQPFSASADFSGMEKYEEEGDGYQNPMLYLTPVEFPDSAREQILRLTVDVLFYLDQRNEMMEVIGSLQNKNYKNVKEKAERG